MCEIQEELEEMHPIIGNLQVKTDGSKKKKNC